MHCIVHENATHVRFVIHILNVVLDVLKLERQLIWYNVYYVIVQFCKPAV